MVVGSSARPWNETQHPPPFGLSLLVAASRIRRLPDGGKPRDYEHPLARVLHDQPNSWQTAYEFRAMLQAHLSLRGNAYARIVAANGNPVAALLPLHPDRVRPLPERVGGRLAYEYVPRRGAREVLLQEEVLHLRGLSLAEDGVIGPSPLDCMC